MSQRHTRLAGLGSSLGRAARRVRAMIAECDYAQRRATTLMTAPDRFLIDRDKAPQTYSEFLFRTSSGLLHEPSARRRARGQLIG